MFKPEVFWKQMYCIEENICDIVGTFRGPPCPPRYAPGSVDTSSFLRSLLAFTRPSDVTSVQTT